MKYTCSLSLELSSNVLRSLALLSYRLKTWVCSRSSSLQKSCFQLIPLRIIPYPLYELYALRISVSALGQYERTDNVCGNCLILKNLYLSELLVMMSSCTSSWRRSQSLIRCCSVCLSILAVSGSITTTSVKSTNINKSVLPHINHTYKLFRQLPLSDKILHERNWRLKNLILCSTKCFHSLSIEWNSVRLGGPVHKIVTKLVRKTLLGLVGVGEGDRVIGYIYVRRDQGVIMASHIGWTMSAKLGSPWIETHQNGT